MPYIMNALDKKVTVKVYGKYFEFNPKQIKSIVSDGIAQVMESTYGSEGLVAFPEEAMDWDRSSPEWKALLEDKTVTGKANRLKKLEEIRYNEEVSLKRDLDSKNLKTSPFTFGNSGLVSAFKELLDLKKDHRAQSMNFEEQLKQLTEKIDGDPVITDTRTANTGSPTISKPAQAGK